VDYFANMMTAEDIVALVKVAVEGALASARAVPNGGGGGGRLDEKYFRRVDKFDGQGKHSWREFSFQFKTAVGMGNPKARSFLEEIQKGGKDVQFSEIFGEVVDPDDRAQVERLGAEIYAMLSTLVLGEALTTVRGILTGDGWLAWSKLCSRFDPRTPAKALMAMLNVMNPKKVKDVRHLSGVLEDWEVKVKSLGTDHDVTIDNKIKSAVLTSMCPEEVQNMIFQWMDTKTTYEDLRDKIMTLSLNRAGEARPKPMEVDQIREDWWYWDNGGEFYEYNVPEEPDKEVEVDYVGETCLRCGGMGHYARECPTPKGKGKGKNYDKGQGKGGKGYDKGYGKGFDKGYGKGFYSKGYGKDGYGKNGGEKGKGKGFTGTCFTCGEVGHRAASCPKKPGNNMEIGAVAEASVGGVWEIAAVEEWKEVKADNNNKFKGTPPPAGTYPRAGWFRNMFEGLEVAECEEGDTEEWPKVGEVAYVKKGELKTMRYKQKSKDCKCVEKEGGCENFKELAVCAVPFASAVPPGLGGHEVKWKKLGLEDITIDSAAEESVCPRNWATEFGTKVSDKKLRFINASGGEMGHYGERVANFCTVGEAAVMSLTFQVSDVKKPLAAVRRIAEKGNKVQFGPMPEDNYIMNVNTGKKVMMIKKGGSYVVPAELIMKEGFTRQAC
jgi:hypothetical protein